MSTLSIEFRTPIVDAQFRATKQFQDFLNKVVTELNGPSVLNVVTDFQAAGNGIRNDTVPIQTAVSQAAKNGGGTVFLPAGTYLIDQIVFPVGNVPITLLGQGQSSIIKSSPNVPASGGGRLDVSGSNVNFFSFVIEGAVTTPVGLFYNQDFSGTGSNDPMAASLTTNSSIWLHGGTTGFVVQDVIFQHSGGYACLIDAGQAGIEDVRFLFCNFKNNRPNLFGIPGGQAIYGSWTGGVFVNGDGRAANPGRVCKKFFMSGCSFARSTGNQMWMHLYGLDELHQDFRVTDCFFEDIGLDGILMGGVIGGLVSGNTFRRIGYTTLTDTDSAIPRWLPNLNATAIDSSGLVLNLPYCNNSFLSINGGCLDLDGHGDSVISGNVCKTPYPDQPEYTTDKIATSGPTNSGPGTYGVNLGNTSNTKYGGQSVDIVGNTFINLPAGSVRLYSARNCLVEANNIIAPDVPIAPPIAYGPGGPGVNQQPKGNVIKHNRIQYSPPSSAPAIFEDATVGPFTSADVNYVFGNSPIIGNGNGTEFQKNSNSGSPVYASTVWFP